ncbi:MAG: endonuclease/exonuclease/phosphatase family protein [Verrucomicrobiales bacterium]
MLYPRSRPWPAYALLAGALLLHLACFALYLRLPDRFAAFTTFPIWTWGSVGLGLSALSYLLFRTPFSLVVSALWLVTILGFSDEARVLGHPEREAPQAGEARPVDATRPLRVITLNCAGRSNFEAQLAAYQPDVVFLQELPHSYQLKQFTDQLYAGRGDYRFDTAKRCAVIVRGTLSESLRVPKFRSQHLTATLADGRKIQLLNLHLQSACKNLRLWERSCWREHRANRQNRRLELLYALELLRQKTPYPEIPALIAGDFNAPANDPVYELLRPEFLDAFAQAGSGWANTYHRRLPVLRIDHIYASTARFVPVRCRAVSVPDSDHRFLVADYLLKY